MGALNGLMVAFHKIGEEKEAAAKLIKLWQTIKRTDIYVNWDFPGPIRGFFYKPSFFDNSPELKFIEQKFKENGGRINRRFTFGIADAQTAKYISINQNTDPKKLPQYIVASTSVPGIFKYIIEGNRVLVDGFTIDNLNLRSGIKECLEVVSDPSKIIVDVVMTNPIEIPKYNMNEYKTYYMYQRGREIRNIKQSLFYLYDIVKAYPQINWRYLISPKETLPNYPLVPLV